MLESSVMEPGGTIESSGDLEVKFGAREPRGSGILMENWHYRLQSQQTLFHIDLNYFHT